MLQFSASEISFATAVLTYHSTIPTKDEILVPETLLKKRKSQEKEREVKAADLQKKRQVSNNFPLPIIW